MNFIADWFFQNGQVIGLRVGGAFLIIIGGWIFSRVVSRIAIKLLKLWQFEIPEILIRYAKKLVKVTIWAIAGIMALGQLGVHTGPLIAGFGITGFIVGFAMQQTLSNVAAGFMILLYRPYDVGQYVEAGGVSGRVEGMNLSMTVIRSEDNAKFVVPNGKIWGGVIKNKTEIGKES